MIYLASAFTFNPNTLPPAKVGIPYPKTRIQTNAGVPLVTASFQGNANGMQCEIPADNKEAVDIWGTPIAAGDIPLVLVCVDQQNNEGWHTF